MLDSVQSFNARKGRYVVDIGSECLSLKQGNLQQFVQGVTVTGIQSRAEMNGKKGNIISFKGDRYIVQIRGSAQMALKPGNVILPNGTCVFLQGLSKVSMNGKRGTIQSHDRGSGRYHVKLSQSQIVKIKLENVRS